MKNRLRRLLLILAGSTGLIAASAVTAEAGFNLANHCEPAHGMPSHPSARSTGELR